MKCRKAGIRIIMITGDASRTALAIAREIGLVTGEPAIVEGEAFPGMADRDLREVLKKPEVIFTRMTPKHKLRVVNILKEEGERVAVTGDGVNDAPALKRADIGIAMGLTGTDVAKEAADMVLLDDNFATIVNAIEEGRAIFENIKKFITYIFAHLTPEAVPYILYALFRIPLPITVMQILAIDLGTETIPALALGVEPPEANIMERPPRPAPKQPHQHRASHQELCIPRTYQHRRRSFRLFLCALPGRVVLGGLPVPGRSTRAPGLDRYVSRHRHDAGRQCLRLPVVGGHGLQAGIFREPADLPRHRL